MSARSTRLPPAPKDHEVWEAYTDEVTPLEPRDRRKNQPAPDNIGPKSTRELRPPISAIATPSATVPRQKILPAPAELDRLTRRKVRRGAQPIDERIDLHGLTQALAHRRLLTFLQAAQARGARLVMVITGKGRSDGVEGGPGQGSGVLRRSVPLWLEEPQFRALVAAMSSAAPHHGGEGALYLRLRRSARS